MTEPTGPTEPIEPTEPGDFLRTVLAAEAAEVVPTGDGLYHIQARVARRRRTLRWLRPVTAVAVLAAAAGVAVALTSNTGGPASLLAASPSATPNATTPPSPSTTPATTKPAASGPTLPAGTLGLWPFRTPAEVSAWSSGYAHSGQAAWHLDPAATAASFTTGYLGYTEDNQVLASTHTATDAKVTVGYATPDGHTAPSAVIHLVRFGSGSTAPWEVVGTDDTSFTITTPGYGVSVQSPVTVSGRITGVDENIQVQVHQPSSQSPLGSSCCQSAGGSYVPWSAAVSFAGASDPVLTIAAATGGHVVAVERFAVTGVHAIPGTGSSAPPNGYPASFVGVRDNRIAVFASSDGQLQHYLTVPVAGGTASDPQLTDNAYWVYYIQSQGGCATTLMKVAYTGGNPVTVAAPTATAIIGFGTARGEQRLAYIAQACGGAAQDLVAIDTTTGATNRILTPGAPPGFASDPTWAPDGQHLAVIVRTGTAQHLAVYDAFTAHTVGDEQAATPCGQESPGSQLSHPVFDTAGSLLVAIASGGPGSVGSCAGGHLTTLFSLANAGAIAGLDATPDGSAILVSAFPATGGTAQVSRWVAGALSALPGASGSAWASW